MGAFRCLESALRSGFFDHRFYCCVFFDHVFAFFVVSRCAEMKRGGAFRCFASAQIFNPFHAWIYPLYHVVNTFPPLAVAQK